MTEESLYVGIKACGPGVGFRTIGSSIFDHARKNGFNVVPVFIGHGIGTYFHGPPDIYHIPSRYPGNLFLVMQSKFSTSQIVSLLYSIIFSAIKFIPLAICLAHVIVIILLEFCSFDWFFAYIFLLGTMKPGMTFTIEPVLSGTVFEISVIQILNWQNL